MPVTIVEQEILIEDSSGSKIKIKRAGDYSCQMTFSGYLLTEESRRTNVKHLILTNEIVYLREQIGDLLESEEFQSLAEPREHPGRRQFPNMSRFGEFRVGFQDNQFYIELRNTKGVREIVFNDHENTLQSLFQALIEMENWFPDFPFHAYYRD